MSTIAIIEDEPLMRLVLKRMLENGGFAVRAFADAKPALEADLDGVDLVMTDLGMPTPGQEAIKQLRARGEQMPILVLSGSIGMREDELFALGAQAVLHKPVGVQKLVSTVCRLLVDVEPQRAPRATTNSL